ncbi:tetratricopeptide repeat protein [Ekhidna lutea]|uniref:tetratricopeptide repeat protein n=1 Tax=Ekhidna lutea TaxID=447679 RepID=UPI00117C8963|nr:tetratricopeptide repeat protein [Ekhidna lutea]
MKTKYNYELIEDYLNGILDSKTMSEVKHLLETDEVARGIAQGILNMKERFDADESQMDDYLSQTLEKKQKLINDYSSQRSSLRIIKIAAAVLVLAVSTFAIYQLTQPTLNDVLAYELSQPYEMFITSRDGEGSLDHALVTYNNGNYAEVFNYIQNTHTAQSSFLKGLSYLYLEEYESAITELQSVANSDSRFEEQARWYLAIAYLQTDEPEKAKAILAQIKGNPNHYKAERAVEILDLLK